MDYGYLGSEKGPGEIATAPTQRSSHCGSGCYQTLPPNQWASELEAL